MLADFSNLHAYTAERLIGFYCHLSKRYLAVPAAPDGGDEEEGSPRYELGIMLGTTLGILNACLSNRLRHNPNLIYTILVEKAHFTPPAHDPRSANELENINILIRHFESRLERADGGNHGDTPTVAQVLTVIQAGAQSLPDNTLKKLPALRLTYVEREDMHTFFLKFIHELIDASDNGYERT
jgi:dymeclin